MSNQTPTPRTDALRKTYAGISNANPNPLLDHHAQLERELIEAKKANKAIINLDLLKERDQWRECAETGTIPHTNTMEKEASKSASGGAILSNCFLQTWEVCQ